MRELVLSQGKVAIVDDEDYEYLSQWKWTAERQDKSWYAVRTTCANGRTTGLVYMHRQILSAPEGLEVDHRSGDGLDNRRSNIRVCTRLQNARNTGPRKHNTSGYKGVSRHSSSGLWVAQVTQRHDGRTRRLRFYAPTKLGAALLYNIHAIREYGEFARLNPIFSGEAP